MNKVILVGRITKDPELRYTPSNVPVCAFSLAVNREYTGANGEREADFINCVAFQKQAENLCKFMSKGSQILVEGRIQVRKYVDNNNVNRIATDVICDKISFLEAKKQEPQQQNYFNQPNYNTGQPAYNQNVFNPNYNTAANQPVFNEPNFDNVPKVFDIKNEDLPF